MDDAELVQAIRSGDQSAWEQLVDRHSPMLWRLARSIVTDDAAASDAMQTAWLQLLQHVDRVADPAAVRSWLATTTRREAIALSKARARQAAADPNEWGFEQATPESAGPAANAERADSRTKVLAALDQLSEKCRQLLTLMSHDVGYHQIADTMDMPIGSIGPTRARCLDQLRRNPAIAGLGVMS